MKKIATRALLWILSLLAQATLTRYHPHIIAITGSVGKTTAKEMTAHLLSSKFQVGKNSNNVNTEWGITATIIDPKFTPLMTSDGWAKITTTKAFELISIGFKNIFSQSHNYPEILVLELAVEKPGDMHWFTRWLRYDVAVITSIGHVHQEFFEDHEHLVREKLAIVNGLKPNGLLIVNEKIKTEYDEGMAPRTLYFTEPEYKFGKEMSTYSFVTQNGSLHITGNQTRPIAMSAPVAAMVALELGVDTQVIREKIAMFKPLSKRFNVLNLKRGIILINDAYNANPESMRVALMGLNDIAGTNRRVAILGEMRELGDVSQKKHLELGNYLTDKLDLLIAVGESGRIIAQGATNGGLRDIKTLYWPSEKDIAKGVMGSVDDFYALLNDNDVVLVKSSKTIGLSKLAENLIIKLS